MRPLVVGLSSWIIQDGNYGEFGIGQEYKFALEFYPHKLEVDESHARSHVMSPIGNAIYDVKGSVIFHSQEAWVIDVGVLAYREEPPPPNAIVGASVSGRMYVGVDPFFYFERLAALPGMPDLFRFWRVRRIQLETTPWIGTFDEFGRELRQRDESKVCHIDVAATDAWHHDDGNGHYLLECEPS